MELVKEFRVYACDHDEIIEWPHEHEIRSVAMGSTGNYWQNLYSALNEAGFEITLANGKFTKNIKGKKTDVLDCQWIQRPHTLGLLSGSFLPDSTTEQLRTYTGHRSNLIAMAASASKKMQKYLRPMNLRPDVVVKDVCGLTGMKIITAIWTCNKKVDSELSLMRLYFGFVKRFDIQWVSCSSKLSVCDGYYTKLQCIQKQTVRPA